MNRLSFTYLLVFALYCFAPAVQAQDQQVFHSDFLNRADTVWIFSPVSYQDGGEDEYPLLFLLHGWSGNYRHWDLMIDCQAYADRYGFVIVCPDGLYDSWYINSPVKGENQYEDFFFEELFPYVTDHYRVDEEEVFISGLSMGGHGALYLMSQHPEQFTTAGSLSGLLKFQAWQNHYALERVLGLDEESIAEGSVFDKYSVMGNIDRLEDLENPIIVSCGTADPFYAINLEFIDSCKKHDVKVKFIEAPGAHNSQYWRKAVNEHFEFFQSLTAE